MKKSMVVVFALFFAFLNFSCITVDPQKLYPDMIADMDPVPVGMIEAEMKTLIGQLNKVDEIEAVFYPRYNTVALNFKNQTVHYHQFWSQEGRELFIKAVESYNADYAARNLGTKASRTRGVYGKFTGKLEWTFYSKFSERGYSSPVIELGYSFQGARGKETPFFTVTQSSADEESSAESDDPRIGSVAVYMYFTREQAASLARVFDQASLLTFIEAASFSNDEYSEDGQAEGYKEADF